MDSRSKKKRRRSKPTAQPSRKQQFLDSFLAGILSGLTVLAITKLLGW